MDMRIEFEAAMAKQLSSEGYSEFSIELMFERGSDDEYRSIRVNGAYWGWQASRESLAVELPENYPFNKQPKYESDRAQTIRECREAIEAQGIRTK